MSEIGNTNCHFRCQWQSMSYKARHRRLVHPVTAATLWIGSGPSAIAEQSDGPTVSPAVIKSITDLLKAAGHVEDTSLFSSERLHGIAEILGAIGWPAVLILAIVLFRLELRDLIKRVRKVGIAGTSLEAEEEIQKKVEASAAAVLSSPSPEPPASISSDDIRRAAEVGALSAGLSPESIRSQIDQIAAEYEGLRANMSSSPARTRQMGAVMAKMRTLARAVFPYRHELVASPSPGHRLFAIAALQIVPDYNLLDWLAAAVSREAPYIQYQALNALMTAVRNAGPGMKTALKQAIETAKSGLSGADPDSSRRNLALAAEAELARIPG
jgi:hypothetical protein